MNDIPTIYPIAEGKIYSYLPESIPEEINETNPIGIRTRFSYFSFSAT